MSTSMTPPGGKRPVSGSTDTPTRDKRLKTIACDRCRRRKVKCDGDGYNQTPCKYCVSVNLDCTYGQKTTRTNSQSSSKANSTSRQTGRNPSRSKTPSSATNNTESVVVNLNTSTNRQRRASSHVIPQQNAKQNAKKTSSSSILNLSINSSRKKFIPQDLPTPDSNKNDYEYMIKLYISTTLQNEIQVRQQLKRYVQVPQVEESSPPRIQSNNALLDDVNFTGHLVNLYFKNFHPFLPVLHKAYFMERFNDKNKLMSPLLLNAVCAIGSSYTNNPSARQDGNNPYTVGLAFYESAQDMVKHYFDLPRLSTATALFLLGIFDALRSLRSRMYVGMATTLAITMRFHDKNAFPETLSVYEREARKRLWWSIAIANRLQCITLNRMLAFQDNHCNIGYPDDNCVDDTENKITVYFRSYLTITNIIYEILEFNLSDNDNNINLLEDKLSTWKKQLPHYLSIDEAKGLDKVYDETTIEHLRIYLCILYNYAMIRIHHPNIPFNNVSLNACTLAANNITSLVNEQFVNVINSKKFIIHCALYAGFIHIYNLKDQLRSKDSRRNIAFTIKFFQNILNVPSLHHTHYSIKNSIAIFAVQLEDMSEIEDYITDIVKSALVLISGNSGNNSSLNESPISSTSSNEESRNINNNNNNNVNNIMQDNSPINLGIKKLSPIQQSAQPGISLLAQPAATRSPHFGSLNHGSTGLQQSQQMNQQSQQQQTQSIFAAPTPLDPPVTNPAKIDNTNSLMSDINYTSAHYIHQHSNQPRQHDNNSTWQSNYNNYQQWQHHQTQPHQNVQQQNTISPTGNEAQTMMVINNSPVTTTSPLRMTSSNSSSLAPLLIGTSNTNTTFTSSQMHFPYQNSALPSMSFLQSQTYQASNNTSAPSTIGIGGNFVGGNDISTGLAPMTGMLGNSGGVTNGMMSTSENSGSMLIDSQGNSTGDLDAQQHHHHHHHQKKVFGYPSY
ncbi:unnamed protein product [Rhizophagus irregularis]|uniref:Zn(2)-C6 fungal-type domain-containing protein n=1 Tax=Rhizophagus irregularis TaxID=588596 RepID=A0A2I1H829_9GLOM|nr:hypothetical protein RhiirA4_503171 [Rhizophagus irregularis]CAB4426707.1 unnamed protein product [Rhizophagus irregularis]